MVSRKRFKKSLAALGMTMMILTLFAGTASTAEYTIRLALIASAGQPIDQGAQLFKKLVEEGSKGKIEVKVFPGGQLGGEIQLQDSVSTGIIQMASIGTPVMSGKLKKLDILNMYYLWRDRDHMKKVLQGPIGNELFAEYKKVTKIRVLAANWQQGTRQTVTKREVKSPADFKGMKIRVTAGVPIYDQLWTAMGTNPVPLSFTEAYSSMQTGVVDAIELPPDFILKNGFDNLGTHLIMTSHYLYSNVLIVNDIFFNKLPDDLQKLMADAAIKAGEFQTNLVLTEEKMVLETLSSGKLIMVTPDVETFAKSVQPVFEKNMVVWGQDLYDKIMAE